jgi:hypothetical protein
MICTLVSASAKSQCTPSGGLPSAPNCSTATILSNGVSVGNGKTYSDQGMINDTFSNVAVNGGTLVLCGTTTLINLSFNSGTVYVSSGANVTFTTSQAGPVNGSVDAFYNFGTSTFNVDVACNKNGLVYNAAGASITVRGDLTLNQGNFYNNGTVTADTVTINSLQPADSACLGPVSSVNVTTIIANSATDPVTFSGSGNACIGFGGSIQGSTPLTTSSNVILCVMPNATVPTAAQAGSATIVSPCPSCSVALPVTLVSFTGKENGTQVELQWVTAIEQDLKSFVIEQSTDGRNFNAIDTIAARDRASTYSYTAPIQVTSYFRLKMIDINGKFTYSPVVVVGVPVSGIQLSILSNPALQSYLPVSIYVPGNQVGELTVLDALGRSLKKMKVSLIKGNNNLQVNLTGISAGHYYLYFIGASEKSQILPFIKL